MSGNHTGFALFMSLLLIAPQIPIRIPGGIERSCVSLGLAGLIIWFFASSKRLFSFPRLSPSHPLFWIIIFAIYAFVVSLLSASMVSIAYSVQFLAYAVLGTILMRRYARDSMKTNASKTNRILFGIAILFSIGILVSVLTGPIYPHQKMTAKMWGGFYIRRGPGFCGNANMAGAVVTFFIAACIYMYRGKIWKKWILLSLLLLALLATLSRGAIVSFIGALALVYCLACVEPLVQRASIKVSVLKNVGFVISALSLLLIAIVLGIYLLNKSFPLAILSGFGLSGEHGLISSDMAARFNLWWRGLNTWVSGSLLKMIFGGGFRSSMTIASTGAWKTAHNMYITVLGDFGIVGLALFSASLLAALWRYIRFFLVGKSGRLEKFGLMVVLAFCIQNTTEVFFYSPICLSLLIFTLAVTL